MPNSLLKGVPAVTRGLIAAVLLSLSGCGEPEFPAWQTTMEEAPGVVYLFSAAEATSGSPVIMTVQGRELRMTDRPLQLRLIRKWVGAHAPMGSTMTHWASALCDVKREGEFPGCHVFGINDPAGKAIEYYFYDGNWYRLTQSQPATAP
jgi:hypothetical protein